MNHKRSSRKRLLFLLPILSLLLTLDLNSQVGQQYSTPVSATEANTAVTFGFSATSLAIKNDGPQSVFLDFTDTTAATTNFELKNGETVSLTVDRSGSGWPGFGAICSAGQTATVRVLAIRNF
jgi:hypothetical protein